MYCNVCVYVCIAISCTCMCVCTYVFGDHLVQAFSLLCHPSLEKLIIIIIIIIITALYGLAEHCEFGQLHDELIRDRIVVGIRDITLSEKMQMDPKLDLAKAANYASC